MGDDRRVMNDADIDRAITRMAHEVLESNRGAAGLIVVGIRTRGVPLAERLAAKIAAAEGMPVARGELDITLYRDDLRRHPTRVVGSTRIAGGVDAKTVILVDDVLYSGRTIAAALDAISDIGRPLAVRLVVLVDRGHRQLPISADFVGKVLPTAATERVTVHLAEIDGVSEVTITQGGQQ